MTCMKKLIKEMNYYASEAEYRYLSDNEHEIIITLTGKNKCCNNNRLPNSDIAVSIYYYHDKFLSLETICLNHMNLARYVWRTNKNWLRTKRFPSMSVKTIQLHDCEFKIKGDIKKLIMKIQKIIKEKEKVVEARQKKAEIDYFCEGLNL